MNGRFIAIEGGDGSGKATQAELLQKYFEENGEDVFKISFPQYGAPSAAIVEMYLNGKFGEAGQAPELASLAYAIDRSAAAPTIQQKLGAGVVVIADRYVASNLAHQAASLDNAEERKQFYELVKDIEYGVLGIPRPDVNIVLSVPTALAQANVDKKDKRAYTDKTRDIHEADFSHLEKAKRNYSELCELYPDEFTRIDCTDEGRLRPIPEIHEELLKQAGYTSAVHPRAHG